MEVAVGIRVRPIVRLLPKLAAIWQTAAGFGFRLFIGKRRAGSPGSREGQVCAQVGEVQGDQGPH